MAVNGTTTNENGDAILISLQTPYKNVVEVLGYTDETVGEDTSVFYSKSFRWGIDGVTYSDYVPLTNVNLEALSLNPNNPFWIQYKYEQVGDGTLEFKSIALEIVTDGGIICKIPQIECCDGQTLSGAQNLVVDCCETPWNPYDLSRASQMYNQLSAVASNLFGFCVKYFKTEADQRSRDVILKEYSLFDVIASAEVKIMIPDNELPTREIQFNPLMMDWPVQFEVHIVKSAFEQVFGVGAKPQMRDYLYFEQYMNQMYEIDAVAEADDFLYSGSYWRVSLVPYQQRTAVLYPDKNIEAIKDSLVSSEEKFAEEREAEFEDVRKPNQYNTIGTLSNDYVRRILDKKLFIKEENVYNNWTIISKYNYQLGSMDRFQEAVEYRYDQGWTTSDNRAFTFWVRPKYDSPIGTNVLITSLEDSSGYLRINTGGLPEKANKLSVGDWIVISGTNSYNSIHRIVSINESTNSLIVDTAYIDNVLLGTPKFNREKSANFLCYENSLLPPTKLVSFTYTPNWFIIKLNDTYHKFKLSLEGASLVKDEWYAFVINLNNVANQLSLFIYNTIAKTGAINPDLTNELNPVYSKVTTVSPIAVDSGNSWKLLGSSTDITNIRIWKSPIEEELQELILSQYVVKDTHLTLLLDNATPQLLLEKQSNPR